jgi:anti-anti-sigma factor
MGVPASQFAVTEIEVDGLAGIAVAGEVSEATCGELEAALAEMPNRGPVILDLDGCSFMDSKGLDAILRSGTRLLAEGRQLVLHNARGPVRGLLRITGLTAWDGLLLHRDLPHGMPG